MPQHYIRLVTHGVVKVDLTKPPSTFTGIASKTPTSGGVLLIAKSETKFLCLYTLGLINTDLIASYFSIFTEEYTLEAFLKVGLSIEEQNFQTHFYDRLKDSLTRARIPVCKSRKNHYCTSPTVGILFNNGHTELHTTESTQAPPFADARMAINHFNYFGSYKPSSKYVDYALDLQFDDSPTPLPKLNEQGYMLWNILQRGNFQLLSRNPHFKESVKEFVESNQTYLQKTLKNYVDYLKVIKSNGSKHMQACKEKYNEGKFLEAAQNAEKALQNFLSVNELHVLEELSLGYYNLGSALLQARLFPDAKASLLKSQGFARRVGNKERLAKIEGKLTVIKDAEKPILFTLPWEVLLNILENLAPPNIARFACTSSYSNQVAREGILWQRKLFKDFTRKLLPESEMTYQQQYKQKYQQIVGSDINQTQSLRDAIKIGAEVWFEKLILRGAKLEYNGEFIENLLQTPNPAIIDLAFKYGLDINKALSGNSINDKLTIFHIAVLKKPELLARLTENPDDITIFPRMHVAVLCNNMSMLKKAFEGSQNVDEEDLCKFTALWWAIILNRTTMAIWLKERHADLRKVYKTNYCLITTRKNLLEYLVVENKQESLELLLSWGLSPNKFVTAYAEYKSLLAIAAECGNDDIIRMLQLHGAVDNSNLSDNDVFELKRNAGFSEVICPSAFMMAAKSGHIPCLTLFLARGTDINSLCTEVNYDHKDVSIKHNTALFFAVRELQEEVVQFLLENKANPNQTGSYAWYQKETCFKNEEKFTLNELCHTLQFADLKFTKLSYSQSLIAKSWFRILELLLKFGANINQCHFLIHLITTDMCFRVWESRFRCRRELMKNAISRQNFIIGALEMASKYNANFDLQDDKGKTVLHYAASQGLDLVTTYLVEKKKVNINIKDNEGETAIFDAAKNLHGQVYHYLKRQGAIIEANRKGETPNQVASFSISMQYH